MTRDEIIRLGDAASQLLGSDAYQTAMDAARAETFEAWIQTNPSDVITRENQYRLWHAFDLVTAQLLKWKGSAQVEVKNIERSRASALN